MVSFLSQLLLCFALVCTLSTVEAKRKKPVVTGSCSTLTQKVCPRNPVCLWLPSTAWIAGSGKSTPQCVQASVLTTITFLSGDTSMCLVANGNTIDLSSTTCVTANWAFTALGEIQVPSKVKTTVTQCITAATEVTNSPVNLAACSPLDNLNEWSYYPDRGLLELRNGAPGASEHENLRHRGLTASGQCMSVVGSAIEIVPCAEATPFVLSNPPQGCFQQGHVLIGSGAINESSQGSSVALSADGTTALIGGDFDDDNVGAAWVFVLSNGNWVQQGPKLVGSGAVGQPLQGYSVALSADGTTALIGGWGDNNGVGAAWVFVLTNGNWVQQGSKLVGAGAVGESYQGSSVAVSADGTTALIGGPGDNYGKGAAWVFVLSNDIWVQQGNKLLGTGAVGPASQGSSVALSAEGAIALIGGWNDNSLTGAAWVFALSNGNWVQQGSKLVGSETVGQSGQGHSVSLSADGATALIGGWYDNDMVGAAWVFVLSNGYWIQHGAKLVGSGAVGQAEQGSSVAVNADGTLVLMGGSGDNNGLGAAWVFVLIDGNWIQQGPKLLGAGAVGPASQGWSVALSADGTSASIGGPSNYADGAAWVFSCA